MVTRTLLRICDFVFVLRPLILIPAWSFYLLGAGDGLRGTGALGAALPSPDAFVSLTGILASAYLLNQVFDRESDRVNRKCFFVTGGIFRARTVIILAVAFFMVASVAFHRIDDSRRAPLFLALMLALIYTLPPVRLCARPYVDMLANAIGYGGIAYVLGYGAFEGGWMIPIRSSVPYVLLVGATFLHTALLDMEGDKATGKITTAVSLGARTSSVFAVVLNALAVASAVLVDNVTAQVVTGIALPISAFALHKRNRAASSLLVQAHTAIVTAAAAVAWPMYLAVVLPLLVLARYYYRKRFGISYPGLRKTA